MLTRTLTIGITVIIDNARFHQSARIRNLIEQAGCQLIYLPPYSPALNLIEHYWYKLKTIIRKKMRNAKIALFEAMEVTLKKRVIVSGQRYSIR